MRIPQAFFFLTCIPARIHSTFVTPTSIATKFKYKSRTNLFMGGGLNRKGNKQADLLKKMALAKEQNRKENPTEEKTRELTPEEIKERNDRLRFDDLLNSESVTLSHMNEYGEGEYLSKQQVEEEVDAKFAGVDQIYEGDPAPVSPFENLISVSSDNALGKLGTERLLPWLRRGDSNDFVIIVSDPREKSTELRQAVKTLRRNLNEFVLGKLVIINADSPSENKKWMKKNSISSVNILCDEKREWMREYTALGKKRWTMCLFILADGKVQKLSRDLDYEIAPRVIANAVKSLSM